MRNTVFFPPCGLNWVSIYLRGTAALLKVHRLRRLFVEEWGNRRSLNSSVPWIHVMTEASCTYIHMRFEPLSYWNPHKKCVPTQNNANVPYFWSESLVLLLCMFCSVYSVFIVPAGTLRLPWLKFFRAFTSVVRQMPGYNSRRRGTTRTLPN
jgi:hypothetical protein